MTDQHQSLVIYKESCRVGLPTHRAA